MRTTSILAAASTLAAGAAAQNYLGFNTGATFADQSAKFQQDFEDEFNAAKNLKNSPGEFNAARLYTNIQAYAEDEPIEAFEAAIATNTSLLLGVWASGTDNIDNELSALKKAVEKHGSDLTDLVIGISIGSEDLYRISATGIQNEAGVGNSPNAIVGFIKDFKDEFRNTPLANVPVGHVDTWDVWPNTTNKAVIDAVDWVGVNSFPYYENDEGNDIKNAPNLFDRSYETTINAVGGKPVWVTETGWPVTGPTWDEAEASTKNAKYFWDEVGCRSLFGKTPTFWYILRDSNPDNEMKFGITKSLNSDPLFDLSCPSSFDTDSSSSSSSASASATSSAATGSATGTAIATGTTTTGAAAGTHSAGGHASGTVSAGAGTTSGAVVAPSHSAGHGSNSTAISTSGSSPAPSSAPEDDSAAGGDDESSDEVEAGAALTQLSALPYVALALVAGVFTLF